MSTLDNTVFDIGSESQDNSPSYGFGRSFLSSLGTGLLNFGLNQISAHQQRKWQEQMWNKQNQYNTPLAQANRMRAAGLNPYQEMGSTPAGSAGTGSAGAPANVRDPLELLSTFAQIDNLNASTGKLESENEEVLRKIAMLDLAYQRGLIEFADYFKRIEKLWEAYETTGETQDTANLKKTIAESNQSQSSADLNKALKVTEDLLRDPRKKLVNSQADDAQAGALLKGKEKNIKEFEEKYAEEYFEERNKNIRYDTQLKYSQKLVNYAQESATYALKDRYEAEVDHLKTVDLMSWTDNQRKAALHPFEMIIKEECAEKGISESQTAKYLAQFNEIVLRPGFKFSDIPTLMKKWIMDNTSFSTSLNVSVGKK